MKNNMFLELKEYIQYESVPYTKAFICPNCNKSGEGYIHVPGEGYQPLPKGKLIGWCSTEHGFMMVFECPKCFEKYRYHNATTSRYNWELFKDELWLTWILQKN